MLLKIVGMVLGEYLFEGIDGILFKVNLTAVVISALLGFVTIYLSAFISAKKASKVTPMKLLRNAEDIKIKSKKLKTPKIIQKLFKTGGVLAYKNLKRSKKKYRTTVISIAVSIFIFITMSAFINNMFNFSSEYYEDHGYNIKMYCNDEQLKQILALEDIEEYFILYDAKDHDYLKIYDLKRVIRNDEYFTIEELEGTDNIGISIMALDDSSFRKYAKNIGAKYEEIKNKGILVDQFSYFINGEEKNGRMYDYKEGEKVTGKFNEQDYGIEIGKVTDIKPYGLENSYYYGGYIILNADKYQGIEFMPESLMVNSNNPNRLEENIKKISSDIHIKNISEEVRAERAMITVIKIFLYGFIAVITLIGVTNIFNTITSNMELRQKEFAMLKSIGMTKKEFNRMINLETIFYGAKALVYGMILGTFGTFALYKGFDIKTNSFSLPIGATIISAISVFILIFIIMRYSLYKINKQNTIETIRKDNI